MYRTRCWYIMTGNVILCYFFSVAPFAPLLKYTCYMCTRQGAHKSHRISSSLCSHDNALLYLYWYLYFMLMWSWCILYYVWWEAIKLFWILNLESYCEYIYDWVQSPSILKMSACISDVHLRVSPPTVWFACAAGYDHTEKIYICILSIFQRPFYCIVHAKGTLTFNLCKHVAVYFEQTYPRSTSHTTESEDGEVVLCIKLICLIYVICINRTVKYQYKSL